jgi:hypothetical protein
MEVDRKALFPPVRTGHCQQLHPFIFMWWEENFTRDFRLTIVREMLARSGQEPRQSMPVGRPAPASTNMGRLDTRHNKHWPGRKPQAAALSRVFSEGRDANRAIQMCQV